MEVEVVEEVRYNHTFGLLDGVGGGVHGLLVIVCGGSMFSTCF